jgi:ATP-dependent DNA helicase RecQ
VALLAGQGGVTEEQLGHAAATVIEALAGPAAVVRADQLDAVRALALDGRRCLVVQATGWGKSAVYWIAARAMRDAGAGLTLVVSPLLALMRDQVAAASRAGLRAVTLNSANVEDWAEVEAQVRSGAVDVLLVSPERLANPRFAESMLEPLLPRLGLLVIDEAHCISSWGHDFRPDYQRIARLLAANPALPVLATTATANSRVTADVAAQLGADTFVQRGQLARGSLHLSVLPGLDAAQRHAWVDEALGRLPGSGIVYTLTVAEAEVLTGYLAARGHDVAAYTGQLDAEARASVEERLRLNQVKAVVATSALGMGYDKPDLAFCLHVGSPGSPVDYYQQVGRAGRALDTAVVTLLPAETDERIWAYFATASIPDPEAAERVLAELAAAGGPLSVPALEASTGVRRGRLELLLKILAVDGATRRTASGWVGTGQPWTYDHARYAALRAARRDEAALMRAYAHGEGCLDAFLRRALDDDVPDGYRCGRCSVCTGALPAGLPDQPDPATVRAARDHLRGLDVVIEPRKMWATGMATGRGRIGPDRTVQPGRALAFADDPGWPEVPRLLGDPAVDTDPPDWLLDGMVSVLTRWAEHWGQRPSVVVPMPSRSRPRLVHGVAERLAAVGRLPLVDALATNGPAPSHELAPSRRAGLVEASLRLVPGARLDGPVLLVDDVLRTGWTVTVAGALLRAAGTPAVLPLVVHRRP